MKKILIIDDERAIRSTLKEILEFEKYSGKYTGIYCNLTKRMSGHPVIS